MSELWTDTSSTEAGVAETESPEVDATTADIAALAYALWEERGMPEGSPDEDWFRAEQILTSKTAMTARTTHSRKHNSA